MLHTRIWSAPLICLCALHAVRGMSAAEPDPAYVRYWPQWRGPLANGTALEGNPPIEWSEDKNIKWKTPIPGKGSATPIVWNDRIYVATAVETDRKPANGEGRAAEQAPAGNRRGGRRGGFGQNEKPTNIFEFTLVCLDRASGEILWQKVAAAEVPHEPGHGTNTFASGSPITDGESVYVSFGSYGIYRYDMDGNLQWKRDLGDMQTRNGFGEGSSPALYKDTLVVQWDHEGPSFIAALDTKTGETKWQVDRDEPTTWATPLIVEHAGRQQVVTNGTNRVRSYDLATGELLWECGGQVTNPIPSPVTIDDLAIVMTGYRGYAAYAIPLDAKGDITGTDVIAWSRKDTGPYIASPVLYEGRLYFTKDRNAVLYGVDARTGKQFLGPERLSGLNTLYASPVAVAGRIYYTSREGKTLVIKAGKELEVLAENQLSEGIDASPAVVGRQMFLRGEKHLYCVEAE